MVVPGDHDLYYWPPDDEGWRQLAAARLLILGGRPEGFLDAAGEVRSASLDVPWKLILSDGVYACREGGEWWLTAVRGGGAPRGCRAQNRRTTPADDMAHIGEAVRGLWDSAVSLSAPPFSTDDHVRVRDSGDIGVVRRVMTHGAQVEVEVLIAGVLRQYGADSLEKIDGDPSEPSYWLTQKASTVDDFALALTVTKLTNALSDVLYSFSSSKTVFRPYQFIPAIKLLQSPSGRLLIADEVGLGKTIEAGLIWSELEQRIPLRRVLLVTPAALREKWRAEMARRFDRELDLLDISDIREFAERMREDRDPEIRGVISLEALRRPQSLLADLADLAPRFDLVIVDEAHALRNRDTSSFRLGQHLSDWADHLLFLSATPINLGNDDLFNLVNILEGDHYQSSNVFRSQLEPNVHLNAIAGRLPETRTAPAAPLLDELRQIEALDYGKAMTGRPAYRRLSEILSSPHPLSTPQRVEAKRLAAELNTLSPIFTRTTKRDVPDASAVREPVGLNVEWTAAEAGFYNEVERVFRAKARKSGAPPGFTMQMPLRQAASCIPAAIQYQRERIAAGDFDDLDDWLVDAVDDTEIDLGDDAQLSGHWSVTDLESLNRLADTIGSTDTKFDRLIAHLRELRSKGMPQVMVFSFFRRTLAYLQSRLADEYRVRVMTGSTPPEEREIVMADFRAGKFDILLLSEVGSEGLDFEFCNVLVNYDLPWNPMKVEQRIGRLDRFGQRFEKIFVINMHVPGTIETDIFERLYARIGVFKQSIGELEPILQGGDFQAFTRAILDPKLSAQQRIDEANRMAESLERRKHDISTVQESRGLLSYADRLEIDGITETGPADGRYVGSSEILRLASRYVAMHGASIAPRQAEIYTLRLTDELRDAFAKFSYNQPRRGEFQRFQRAMAGAAHIDITFSSAVSSASGIELLSSRHPLVRCAVAALADSPMLHRFATVQIPGLVPGQRVFARVDLAESSGLAPKKELWVTGVDVDTRDVVTDVEGLLLSALAEGTITAARETHPPMHLVERLDEIRADRRARMERERRADNEALVDARIRARQQLIDGKIFSSQKSIQTMRALDRGAGPIRAQEARLASLRRERDNAATELASKRSLTLSSTPVAYVLLSAQP